MLHNRIEFTRLSTITKFRNTTSEEHVLKVIDYIYNENDYQSIMVIQLEITPVSE